MTILILHAINIKCTIQTMIFKKKTHTHTQDKPNKQTIRFDCNLLCSKRTLWLSCPKCHLHVNYEQNLLQYMYFKLHALVHIFFFCVIGILLRDKLDKFVINYLTMLVVWDKLDKFVINYLTMLVVCTLTWVFYPYDNFDRIKSN